MPASGVLVNTLRARPTPRRRSGRRVSRGATPPVPLVGTLGLPIALTPDLPVEVEPRHPRPVVVHVAAPGTPRDLSVEADPEDRPADVRAKEGDGVLALLDVATPGL